MKISALLLALALAATTLLAGDWPAAFERYEAVTLDKPARGEARWQMWKYAEATGRIDELKERWEAHASGEASGSHRLLLALLAELESDFDSAHIHFDRAIDMAPKDAAPWLLRGQMEAERRMPAARATLEKALELAGASELAGQAAVALAEHHLKAGRADEARAVLDRAVETVHDPESWLHLTQKRAEAALAQGRLGEMIAEIRAAPPGPLGGSESAQAYLALQDYTQAGAELERELKKRPQGPLLRWQALNVARLGKHTSELARLLREETKLAPTAEIWRELFHTLVLNGTADEARALLAAQGEKLFLPRPAPPETGAVHPVRSLPVRSDPALPGPLAWRNLVPTLWQLDLARPAAETLAKAAQEGDWEAALLRAELLIAEKNWAPAKEALWSILDPRRDEQPLAADYENGAAHPAAVQQIAAMPGAYLKDRLRRANGYLESTPAPFNPKRALIPEGTTPVQTLTDARDLAILHLGMIAAQMQRAPDFLQRLAQATSAWPRIERFMAFLIVQNPAGALTELEAYAGEARDGRIDRFCRDQLAAIRGLPLEAELTERAAALMKTFPDAPSAGLESLALPNYGERFGESSLAFREGKFTEAWKIFEDTSAAFRASGDPLAERETVAGALSFALTLPELPREAAKIAEGATLAVRSVLPRTWSHRWPTAGEGIEALTSAVTPAPKFRFSDQESKFGLLQGIVDQLRLTGSHAQDKPLLPPTTLFSPERSMVLRAVFDKARDYNISGEPPPRNITGGPVWPLFKKQLDLAAAGLSENESFLMRTAAAYLSWWNKEPADAIARMKQLLAETGDPAIRLGLVAMLQKERHRAEAMAALAEIKPPAPAYCRAVSAWRLVLAAEGGDSDSVLAIAREFAEAPQELSDVRALTLFLERAGCTEAAGVLGPVRQAGLLLEENIANLPSALRELDSSTDRTEIVTLAKRILASWVSTGRSPQITAARTAALQALEKLGERTAYATQLTQEAWATPENVEGWQRVAEVSNGEVEAEAAWRKVLELQPDHHLAERKLMELADVGSEERRLMFEKLLAKEPDDAIEQYRDFLFGDFERSDQLPRLAEAIARAPFRVSLLRRGSQDLLTWRNIAEHFVEKTHSGRTESEREAASVVLRKALSAFEPAPADIRQMMLRELVALNRAHEAKEELVECLAPGTGNAPLLFAWRTQAISAEPNSTIDIGLLKMAQSLGIAPELRGRLERAALRDATARLVSIFLRVAEREPSVLPDIIALLPWFTLTTIDTSWRQSLVSSFGMPATLTSSSLGDTSWVLPLAADLAAWPEAVDCCRQLLTAYGSAIAKIDRSSVSEQIEVAKLLSAVGGKDEAVRLARAAIKTARKNLEAFESGAAARAAAKLALLAGDSELLKECTRLTIDFLTVRAEARSSINAAINAADSLSLAGDLMDGNHLTEAEGILDVLRTIAAQNTDSQIAQDLHPIEAEIEFRKGELRLASPVVWLDADRTTSEQATLIWDLGIASATGDADPQAMIFGEAFPTLDGSLVVELLAGEDMKSMQSVARLENTGSRGVWQGHLPMENGFARAVVSHGDQVLFGEPFQICAGRNLLAGPDAGDFASSLAGGGVKRVKGGPAIEGEFLSFRPFNANGDNSNVAPLGPRVPIKPGRDYLLGGWLRITGTHHARLGWRCLDREGKSVAAGQFPASSAGERYWTRCQQRLSSPREDAESQPLPVNAAFIEPTIQGDGGFDVAGLYIVELPALPPASAH